MSKFYIGNKLAFNPDVKLEKVELTQQQYDDLATKQDNVLYIITDAVNPLEEIQDTIDGHLQNVTSGLNHIPSGGKDRQVLAYQADGKAYWENLNNLFPGLEEILAYGVEWNVNEADPHLKRIGNMSLHKSLPIQSQLKGCIAQKDKVMYWLNEDDWRFRKDPIYMTVDLSDGADTPTFNDPITDLGVGQFVKAGTHIGKIINVGSATVTIEWEENLSDISQELATITKLEIGSRLDGYDGTVRVYCPGFYIKSQIIGDIRRVWLSTVRIDDTWTFQPNILVDAYGSTILNTVPSNMGYLSTLPVNSAISVVNTATYCRGGGNRQNYDQYLTGANGTAIDIFRTDLGKPITSMTRETMRINSRMAGSNMISYDQYKNIFYWLYVVEYANFNCQEAYNASLTKEGYRQGGLGDGVTTINNDYWEHYNDFSPLTPCGYCNEFGNNTGLKTMTIVTPTTSGGDPTQTYNFSVPRWRGFDNPFGDIHTNLDGIIIQGDVAGNQMTVYTTTDPNNYGDNEEAKNTMKIAGYEIYQDGYIKEFDLGNSANIIPESVGGNTTQYKCAYHWAGAKDTAFRTLVVGGNAANSTDAGLGAFSSFCHPDSTDSDIGFRTVSKSVSFFSSESQEIPNT